MVVYYLASERSERDTLRGNTIENRGCLFIIYICLDVRISFCTLTLSYFSICSNKYNILGKGFVYV